MTHRRRFHETMELGSPDRVPYFQEGIRAEVLEAWRRQSPGAVEAHAWVLRADPKVELKPELEPVPAMPGRPRSRSDLAEMERRLDPHDTGRLAAMANSVIEAPESADTVRMLRIHRGCFPTLGVRNWEHFHDLMLLLADDPGIVRDAMRIQGRFCAALAEHILGRTEIDAAVFSEPIGGNDGPLISPSMYRDLALQSYQPVFDAFHRHGVSTIIFRTYANARILLPAVLESGFNCLWACEVNTVAMDYRSIRREFGRDLRLIGGIDLDAIRTGRRAVERILHEVVPPLLEEGGYIPLADGRVREDVAFTDYLYYRRLLRDFTRSTV
jgi:hypothetical protein